MNAKPSPDSPASTMPSTTPSNSRRRNSSTSSTAAPLAASSTHGATSTAVVSMPLPPPVRAMAMQARGVQHAPPPARPRWRPRRTRRTAGRAAPARSGPASAAPHTTTGSGSSASDSPIRKPTTPVSCVTAPSTSSPQTPMTSTRNPTSSARRSARPVVGRSHRTSLARPGVRRILLAAVIGPRRSGHRGSGMGAGKRQGTSAPVSFCPVRRSEPADSVARHGDPPCRRRRRRRPGPRRRSDRRRGRPLRAQPPAQPRAVRAGPRR